MRAAEGGRHDADAEAGGPEQEAGGGELRQARPAVAAQPQRRAQQRRRVPAQDLHHGAQRVASAGDEQAIGQVRDECGGRDREQSDQGAAGEARVGDGRVRGPARTWLGG